MKMIKKKILFALERFNHLALLLNLLKWIFLGGIVGIIIGLLSEVFLLSLNIATDKRLQYPWSIYLLPLGGAFVSFLYTKYGKTSSQGNNLILDQIHHGDKEIPLRMAPLVFIGTVVTHLFGGSAGREGTAVQMGGSIAEFIGRLFKLDKEDRRIILMCGISSGFGAVFGTPLAGTIFGMEVISIGSMEYSALIPCFTASFTGNLIATALGAGFQGGEVTPFFFVGATFGNMLAGVINLFPSFLADLGLVAVFCGATNTPISSFFLGLELFHGEAIVYIFIACIISYLFSGYHGIYTSQKINKAKSKILQIPEGETIGSLKKKRKQNLSCKK
ncbi:chloride channel protein [Clostridium intestinale]|uniref:Cl-channel voltage-gated family protein n=1 Tax=Clostridium intestinale URNW TaxID=1294142 RepID=U2Q3V4_9CLOT|nr:Cl- channel voltage-gated family protein [Clostridium intestinale URNW]